MTNDPDIRFASSLVDYVFRRLALDHLPLEQRDVLGIRSIDERKEEAAAQDRAARGRRSRAAVASVPPAQPVEIVEKHERPDPGRAALLPVRLEDAAGRLLLRLRDLRQHQRLLVSRSRP